MFSLFNFSSIFPGGQLTPFTFMCGRPCSVRVVFVALSTLLLVNCSGLGECTRPGLSNTASQYQSQASGGYHGNLTSSTPSLSVPEMASSSSSEVIIAALSCLCLIWNWTYCSLFCRCVIYSKLLMLWYDTKSLIYRTEPTTKKCKKNYK